MLKAWISSEIKGSQLFGWLLDTDNKEHRIAIVKVNGEVFETVCDKLRLSPQKYPLYKDYGFRIDLPSDFIAKLPMNCEVQLVDKMTNKIVCKSKINKVPTEYNKRKSEGIIGELSSSLKDMKITGWLCDSVKDEPRVAILKLDNVTYECCACKYSEHLKRKGIHNAKNGFSIVIPLSDVMEFSDYFHVKLYDKVTGTLIDQKKYRKPTYLIPSNFNEYLSYSMLNPVVYAPYNEKFRRCFAFMEKVSSFLESEKVDDLCSVIMPVYNRQQSVLNSIQSVLSQSYQNFELIIIDDGSTDGTFDIINSVTDPRVKLCKNKTNQGCSYSRNIGLRYAKGEYVFYLDSDNTWDVRYLKVMMGAFARLKDADALYCGQYLFDGVSDVNYAVRFASFNRSLLENRNYIDINCFGHKRSVLSKVKGFNESLKRLIDYDFILRINSYYSIYSVPVLLSNYYSHKFDNAITLKELTPNICIPRSCSNIFSMNHAVSAVIPNYCSVHTINALKECVASLLDNGVSNVVIVDSGSPSDVVGQMEITFNDSRIEIIKNSSNLGFTYSVNQGLERLPKGHDVLIINNDAVMAPGALSVMEHYAYEYSDSGMIVSRQVIDSKSIPFHVPFANTDKECDVNLSMRYKNIGRVPLLSDGRCIELNYAPLFCAYVRNDIIQLVGNLDAEHGRHYRSDRVFCDYIRNVLGLKIYYVSDAVVYHRNQMATNLLKSSNPALYKVMCVDNTWDSKDRVKFGYRTKVWENELDDYHANRLAAVELGYFDREYYMDKYASEVRSSKLSALEHYLSIGWKKGYNPSLSFDTKWYLDKYSDVKKSGKCPLIHYITQGVKEKRCTSNDYELQTLKKHESISSKKESVNQKDVLLVSSSELFDESWYLNKYMLNEKSDLSPVEHYVSEGWKKGYNPSEKFDTNWYLEKYKDVKRAEICPLVHYIRSGKKERRQCKAEDSVSVGNSDNLIKLNTADVSLVANSDYFDSKWYIAHYQISKEHFSDPVEHYLSIGWKLGNNPSERFNNNLYLDLYPDVKRSGKCPLIHFLKGGLKESRKAIPVFKETPQTVIDRVHSCSKKYHPLISIVVASYNYEGPIRKTLDSILAQTYTNYEVIIVDDGSRDNSVQVITEYLGNKKFHLYTHEGGKNKGLPETVKLGIEKSKGEYIAFCEADDYWDKDYLFEKVNIISKYANANVIINDVQLFGNEEKVSRVNSTVLSYKIKFNQTKTYICAEDFRKQNWILTFSCVMLKKKVFENCDFVNVTRKANLDWWLWRQICLDNYIFYVDKKLTFWRMHDSYMESDNVRGRLQQEQFLTECDRLLLKKNFIKAKALSKYTDVTLKVSSGMLYRNGKVYKFQPAFSVIMPTFNRGYCIKDSVDAILRQTYTNFELIIVDDGSTDQTKSIINDMYADELAAGKIKYIYKDNEGVCKARNVGLSKAKNNWITYVDSDNICSDVFLETFAVSIVNNPSNKAFYARLVCWESNKKSGVEFDLNKLLKENYIDLGVYCHSVDLYNKCGGFDENMTRLVDWELITRYSKTEAPLFIDKVILLYSDKQDSTRITVNYNLYDNYCYFRRKHCAHYPLITTVITTYNHEQYIAEAIESAIVQVGEFRHEILISDDCSSDNTKSIIESYVSRFPNLIRDISSNTNLGISLNMKKCFSEANGDFIAVLEGDDYWSDKYKLHRQMKFLLDNNDCSMVFSRIRLLSKGKFSLLDRHNNLATKLSGDDVIKESTLNYIANFSCCLFRTDIMKNLPDILFEDRFNEIALSFYIVRHGFIGFIPQIMSVYRLHDNGVWSASDALHKLRSGLRCRETALAVCEEKYAKLLQDIIENKFINKIKELEGN